MRKDAKYCTCLECTAYYSGKGGKGCQDRGTSHKVECQCRYCKKFGNLERNRIAYNKRVAETLDLARVARKSLDQELAERETEQAELAAKIIRVDFVARRRIAS